MILTNFYNTKNLNALFSYVEFQNRFYEIFASTHTGSGNFSFPFNKLYIAHDSLNKNVEEALAILEKEPKHSLFKSGKELREVIFKAEGLCSFSVYDSRRILSDYLDGYLKVKKIKLNDADKAELLKIIVDSYIYLSPGVSYSSNLDGVVRYINNRLSGIVISSTSNKISLTLDFLLWQTQGTDGRHLGWMLAVFKDYIVIEQANNLYVNGPDVSQEIREIKPLIIKK